VPVCVCVCVCVRVRARACVGERVCVDKSGGVLCIIPDEPALHPRTCVEGTARYAGSEHV
jgi:hypothetical protein